MQAELNAPEKALRCSSTASSSLLQRIKALGATSDSKLPTCIPLNALEFGLVTSMFTLGGLLGALSAGPLSTRSGRVLPQRLTTIGFTLGGLLSALAPSAALLATGRFLSGIGEGAATVVVPIYISEIVPKEMRGVFGALTQITTNVGIVITQLLGYFLSYGNMWRLVLAVAAMIGVVQSVGLLFVVESPEWLSGTGKQEEARRNLARIRGSKATGLGPLAGDLEDASRKLEDPRLAYCSGARKAF